MPGLPAADLILCLQLPASGMQILEAAMKVRQAGGGKRSGRYMKHDTARLRSSASPRRRRRPTSSRIWTRSASPARATRIDPACELARTRKATTTWPWSTTRRATTTATTWASRTTTPATNARRRALEGTRPAPTTATFARARAHARARARARARAPGAGRVAPGARRVAPGARRHAGGG